MLIVCVILIVYVKKCNSYPPKSLFDFNDKEGGSGCKITHSLFAISLTTKQFFGLENLDLHAHILVDPAVIVILCSQSVLQF